MKKISILAAALLVAGAATQANASLVTNPGAANLGINFASQLGQSGNVGQTLTASQAATATVNHTGANTIGQTATATNTGGGLQVGSGDNLNFGSAGDTASASNSLYATARSGAVSNILGQANLGGAVGGGVSAP